MQTFIFKNEQPIHRNNLGNIKAAIMIIGDSKADVHDKVHALQSYGFGALEQYTSKKKPITIKYNRDTGQHYAHTWIFQGADVLNIKTEEHNKKASLLITYLEYLKTTPTARRCDGNLDNIAKLTKKLTKAMNKYKATTEPKSEAGTPMNIRPASKRGLKRPTGMMV